jgi:hypothetical protein
VSVPLAAADAGDLQTAARAFDLAGLAPAGSLAEADLPEHASRDVDRWMGT